MPTIDHRTETRLWDGATIAWDKHKAHESLRCSNFYCRKVLPGIYMREVDPQTGLCWECKKRK